MNASLSLLLTLGFGVLIFQGILGLPIPINWLEIDLPMLALCLLLGTLCFVSLGYILSGINIMTSRVQFMLSEYVSSILYLFGGVIFTPELLPSWGQAVSNALPVTYFLKSVRYSILHQAGGDFQTSLMLLALTTLATAGISVGIFRFAMYKARKDGLIDKKEEY
ncbi:ABC transporter permease [Candidatus Bathyarchaeota archaeon]|nr:ABC transporter permease [Candidatus Bathyarchaeota archaeon]